MSSSCAPLARLHRCLRLHSHLLPSLTTTLSPDRVVFFFSETYTKGTLPHPACRDLISCVVSNSLTRVDETNPSFVHVYEEGQSLVINGDISMDKSSCTFDDSTGVTARHNYVQVYNPRRRTKPFLVTMHHPQQMGDRVQIRNYELGRLPGCLIHDHAPVQNVTFNKGSQSCDFGPTSAVRNITPSES